MPCGRESRSARRLRPLVLMLVVFSAMPRGTLSRVLGLPPQPPPVRNITCKSIPYPFGRRGRSLPFFQVTCGPNNEAMLPIGDNSYKIDDVSVGGGFVVILAGPISQVCHDRNGNKMQSTGIGNISLEQTPFSFSKRNKLVATGCNHRLVANFGNSSAGDTPWLPTSCISNCSGGSNAVDCLHGVACCEALMPMPAAQEFNFAFDKISGGDENGNCSAVFFLDQEDQVFTDGRGGGQRPLKDVLLPVGDRRMILDWAVGLGTCEQALYYNVASVLQMDA